MIFANKLFNEYKGNPKEFLVNFKKAVDAKEITANDISFGDLYREAFGPDWKNGFAAKMAQSQSYSESQLFQEETVMPSTFAHISGVANYIGNSLLEAKVKEGYEAPEFLGSKFFDYQATQVNGGRIVRTTNTGEGGDATRVVGSPLPEVGLGEEWINVPTNEQYGCALSLHELDYVYDRTGQMMEAAYNAGYAVRRQVEQVQADIALGITTAYTYKDVANATYQTAKAASPFDFANEIDASLEDYTDWADAWALLQKNTDPATGFEVSIPINGSTLFVSPDNLATAKAIFHAQNVILGTALTGNYPGKWTTANNPITDTPEIVYSSIWYNRLIAASVSVANAKSRWYYGMPKKAFVWKELIPFTAQTWPVSYEQAKRGIATSMTFKTYGVGLVKDPRFMFRGGTVG